MILGENIRSAVSVSEFTVHNSLHLYEHWKTVGKGKVINISAINSKHRAVEKVLLNFTKTSSCLCNNHKNFLFNVLSEECLKRETCEVFLNTLLTNWPCSQELIKIVLLLLSVILRTLGSNQEAQCHMVKGACAIIRQILE
jgi:hypothetical protein